MRISNILRLYGSSWRCAVVLSVACACLVLPGEGFTVGAGVSHYNGYEHGWPRTYLERYVSSYDHPDEPAYRPAIATQSTIRKPCWLNIHGWYIWRADESSQVHAISLAADLAVAGAIIVVGSWLFEVRRRRRNGVAELRIADFVYAMVGVALVCAWFHICKLNQEQESEVVASIEKQGHSVTKGYFGPRWLERLCGLRPKCCERAFLLSMTGCSQAELETLVHQMGKLKYLEELEILAQEGELRLSLLRPLKTLRSIDFIAANDSIIEELCVLTQLRRIDLSGTSVTGAGVEVLRERLPRCEVIPP